MSERLKTIFTILGINLLVAALAGIGAYFFWIKPKQLTNTTLPQPTEEPAFHEHIDFKIVMGEQPYDFSTERFQSSEEKHLHETIHLHDGNGEVLHFHAAGADIRSGLGALGVVATDTCVTLPEGTEICNTAQNAWRFVVSGQEVSEKSAYKVTDLDRVLLIFTAPTRDITPWLNKVSDDACIYSEKCPERGKPPTENCVGGLGSTCAQ
jgi:hypothetical protein